MKNMVLALVLCCLFSSSFSNGFSGEVQPPKPPVQPAAAPVKEAAWVKGTPVKVDDDLSEFVSTVEKLPDGAPWKLQFKQGDNTKLEQLLEDPLTGIVRLEFRYELVGQMEFTNQSPGQIVSAEYFPDIVMSQWIDGKRPHSTASVTYAGGSGSATVAPAGDHASETGLMVVVVLPPSILKAWWGWTPMGVTPGLASKFVLLDAKGVPIESKGVKLDGWGSGGQHVKGGGFKWDFSPGVSLGWIPAREYPSLGLVICTANSNVADAGFAAFNTLGLGQVIDARYWPNAPTGQNPALFPPCIPTMIFKGAGASTPSVDFQPAGPAHPRGGRFEWVVVSPTTLERKRAPYCFEPPVPEALRVKKQ